MPVRLTGSTSGYTELDAGAVAGNNTIKMPTSNGAAYQLLRNGATAGTLEYTDNIVSGTAQASTSGTSIDFTGIPSWAKRVTVMLNGVSTNGTSNLQVQIGSGSVTTTGYVSNCHTANTLNSGTVTTGYIVTAGNAATVAHYGLITINLIGSNTYIEAHSTGGTGDYASFGGGGITLSGTLDRIRVTTVNGTDTFDAGTINILYE